MAAKTYRCTNYGDCDLALNKEIVEIEEGDDVVCPSCSKNSLVAADSQGTGGGQGSLKKLVVIGAAVVVVALVVWVFWPSSPDQDQANALLTEFFPKLPPPK